MNLCACGCGTELKPNCKGRMPTWVRNHNNRGVKHSEEWKRRQGAGIAAAWRDPNKMCAVRHPHPSLVEKRAAALRGRKLPAWRIEQMRHRMTGRKVSDETRAKLSKAAASRTLSPRQLDALARNRTSESRESRLAKLAKARLAKLDMMEELRPQFAAKMKEQMSKWKQTGQLEEIRRKAGNLRGMPEHIAAKAWVIRDPCGRTYHFTNLAEWARQHEHLFEDDRPESKQPFSKRIAEGLSEMLTKGKTCSYRGWVAVSNRELLAGAPDLVGRNLEAK